jgi:hypothetical protein
MASAVADAIALRRFTKTSAFSSRLRAVLRDFTDMGDKSPKTKNKQAAQKQAKANAAAKQKTDNKAAGQTVKPKR